MVLLYEADAPIMSYGTGMDQTQRGQRVMD